MANIRTKDLADGNLSTSPYVAIDGTAGGTKKLKLADSVITITNLSSVDLNTLTTQGCYLVSIPAGTNCNQPNVSAVAAQTVRIDVYNGNSTPVQTCVSNASSAGFPSIFMRRYTGGAWTTWKPVASVTTTIPDYSRVVTIPAGNITWTSPG